MKTTILLSFAMLLTLMSQATVSLTVNSIAGSLSTLITTAGGNLNTITDLTVTGTIDARDFGTMNALMPMLSNLDLSSASIVEFKDKNNIYLANQMPLASFCNGATGAGKTTLKTIILPNGLTSIGGSAFRNCTGINSINLPSGITSIESAAFMGCTGITSITFPSGFTSIGTSAFSDSGINEFIVAEANQNLCSLNGVVFNKNKTTLILYPSMKTGTYIVPNTVTSIGISAFYGCTGISALTLSSTLTSIGEHAFHGCTGITSLTIPSGITTIELGTFSFCSGLTSIIIPSSVSTMSNGAFFNCINLKTVYSLNAIPPNLGASCFNGTSLVTDVFVPTDAAVTAYKANTAWIAYFPGTIIKKGSPSAVPTLTGSNVKVYGMGNAVIVDGTTLGETVSIYNVKGLQLATVKSQGERLTIPVKGNGIYLVKTAGKAIKVIL